MTMLYVAIILGSAGIGYCAGCWRTLFRLKSGELMRVADHDRTVWEIGRNSKTEERQWVVN